jgi:hypothetical protein
MATASEVLSAARKLSPQQRAEIAHELLLTLEPNDFDENVEPAWAAEVRQRLAAIREGRVSLRDWDVALSDIRRSIHPEGPV